MNAILLTGGIAFSEEIVSKIKKHCGFIAPVYVYPGENEMQSLAFGALDALRGTEEIKDFITYANKGEQEENRYKFPFSLDEN